MFAIFAHDPVGQNVQKMQMQMVIVACRRKYLLRALRCISVRNLASVEPVGPAQYSSQVVL